MSILATLKTDDTIANERDSVGTGGPLESGVYETTISLAYLTKSQGGAIGLVLNLKTDTAREIRSTLWMTSGTAKGAMNYYIDKDGNKQYLPGFNLANSLTLLTVGKEISELDTETKVVNVYSYDAKADVPTKVDMLTDLLGKEIKLGLIKQIVDKSQKNDAGMYVPTGETREENDIDKFFRARDNMTTAEIRGQAEEASFYNTWATKWTGVTKNKSKGTAGAAGAGKPGAANSPSAGTKKPTQSLFA
jgi:hypothetical protein